MTAGRSIEAQLASGTLDLPGGGHVRVCDARKITPRKRRPVEVLSARLGPVVTALETAGRILIDGDVVEDRRDVRDKAGRIQYPGPDVDLTEKQWALLAQMNDALAWAILESWTLDEPLPATPDDLLDIDPAVYDVIKLAAAAMATRMTDGVTSRNGTATPRTPRKRQTARKTSGRKTPRPRTATAVPDAPDVDNAAPVRVIVPYTKLHPETQRRLEEYAPGHILCETPRDDDEAYWRLLRDEWATPGDLVILEQDVGIVPGVVEGFADCRHPWCGHPMMVNGLPIITLGCVRFTAELKAAEPDLLELIGTPDREPDLMIPARYHKILDGRIHGQLEARGYDLHKHAPQVDHYHLATPEERQAELVRATS